jgi:hypothetical protein
VYLTIVIYAFYSIALVRDIALARGIIYDRNTLMVQATTEIVTYDVNIFLVQATAVDFVNIL